MDDLKWFFFSVLIVVAILFIATGINLMDDGYTAWGTYFIAQGGACAWEGVRR